MDEMDDFGDLYADLDHMNAGVADGSEINDFVQHVKSSGINSTPNESESIGGESGSAGGLGSAEGAVDLVDGDMDSSYSSEDDLHIVLNENESLRLLASQRGGPGNGKCRFGEGNEEDEQDLVIVNGFDHGNEDQRWGAQLMSSTNEMVQGRVERVISAVGGCRNRYTGSRSMGFPNYSRTITGQGDWNQKLISETEGQAPCNSGTTQAVKRGLSFFLPRNRTIFDVNIEAIEHKPWRQCGVDIADYFNFGLDEERWKSYCQELGHFTQKARALVAYPGDELSKMNKEFTDGLKSINAIRSDDICSELGGRTIIRGNEDKGSKLLGRAIQVHSGAGERVPSTESWRPRQRDSDVVIHIDIEHSMKNPTISGSLTDGYAERENFSNIAIKCSDESTERVSFEDHGDQECGSNSDFPRHSHRDDKDYGKALSDDFNAKQDEGRDFPCLDVTGPVPGSAAYDFLNDSSSSSEADTDSEPSMEDCCPEKAYRTTTTTLLMDAATELQDLMKSEFHASKSSGDYTHKVAKGCGKSNGIGFSSPQQDHRDCHRSRRSSTIEMLVRETDEQISIETFDRIQNNLDGLKVERRTKQKQCNDVGRLVSSDKELRMPISRKSKRHAGNNRHPSRSSFSNDDHSVLHEQNGERRDHSLGHGVPSWHNANKHKDCYIGKRSRGNVDEPTAKCRALVHGRHKADRRQFLMKTKPADDIYKYRSREPCGQKMLHKQTPHCSLVDDLVHDKATKARQPRCPEMRLKYESRGHDENRVNNLRYFDQPILHSPSYTTGIVNEEFCYSDGISRRQSPSSWYASERDLDCRSYHARKMSLENKGEETDLVRNNAVYHCSYFDNGFEFDTSEGSVDERDVHYGGVVEKRHNWLDQRRLNNRVGLSSPRGSLEGSNSRHDIADQRFTNSRKFHGVRQLDHSQKAMIKDGKINFDDKSHYNSSSDICGEKKHEFGALEHKEAVNVHLNDWKRKFWQNDRGVTRRSMDSKRHFRVDQEVKVSRAAEVPKMPRYGRFSTGPTNLSMQETKDTKLENLNNSLQNNIKDNEDDEIEEGQLIEESEDQNSVNGGYDNNRLLEAMAKMEKRRERFKEPTTSKKGGGESGNGSMVVPVATVDEAKQRPVRKRRWVSG